MAGEDERSATPTTWESYWDEAGQYLVRAVTSTGDAWFSLVDESDAGQARAARLTPRAAHAVPMAATNARRLVFVGTRRRATTAGGASSPLVLVGRRPAAGSRRSYAR